MREIKFRCWDTGINFMYYDPECYNIYNEEDNGLHSGYEDKYGTWHQNKLMQYTGLKDKNGVEIYEGDILQHRLQGNRYVEYGSNMSSYAGYMLVSSNGMRGTLQDTEMLYEVIGNIYENPELLDNE